MSVHGSTQTFTVAPARLVVSFVRPLEGDRVELALWVCDAGGVELYGFDEIQLAPGGEFTVEVERIDAPYKLS